MSLNNEVITFNLPKRQVIFHSGYNDMEKIELIEGESKTVEFEFKDDLYDDNETLNDSSSTVTAEDEDGENVTSTIISSVSIEGQTKLRCKIGSLTAGVHYLVKFKGISEPLNDVLYGVLSAYCVAPSL